MTAIICKDFGCMVNYCGLLKKSYITEWENSSDCKNEYTQFTDCMKMERMRIQSLPTDILINLDKYQYIQDRLTEKKLQDSFKIE